MATRQPNQLELKYREGDIFEEAPKGTVFIHSCNCKGSWGKGFALQLKDRYPQAFRTQKLYCSENGFEDVLGKALLLPPPRRPANAVKETDASTAEHFVACLFTKIQPGRTKDMAEEELVLRATQTSMQQLLDGMQESLRSGEVESFGELRMPKINSGLFNIEWEKTEKVLLELNLPAKTSFRTICVYSKR